MEEINNEKIFDLLAIKTYKELTDVEKKWVDVELSEQEYNDFREVAIDFKDVDNTIETITPKILVKDIVKNKQWWHYRIPTYQVAAVLVIAILSTFMLTKTSLKSSTDIVQANYSGLDTLIVFNKSINMEKEVYPSGFVINW